MKDLDRVNAQALAEACLHGLKGFQLPLKNILCRGGLLSLSSSFSSFAAL